MYSRQNDHARSEPRAPSDAYGTTYGAPGPPVRTANLMGRGDQPYGVSDLNAGSNFNGRLSVDSYVEIYETVISDDDRAVARERQAALYQYGFSHLDSQASEKGRSKPVGQPLA